MLNTLDEELKDTMRAHVVNYRLDDLESDILMCCETLPVRHKKGLVVSRQNGWCGLIVVDGTRTQI